MIGISNLTKYFGKNTVLDRINVQFKSQQVTSLIGPNGAGKSSLLMSMGRLLDFDHGDITLDGVDIRDFRSRDYAKRVATLRQFQNLNMRLTVRELVEFGRFPHSRGLLTAHDHRCVDEAIAYLSLRELQNTFIDELSGGQKQMAFIAMTIAQQTDYLLLDEPLNNLDMKHALQIMRALRQICEDQKRTVILVVHDVNFAVNFSHNIVAMKKGKVQFSGEVNEVINATSLKSLYDIDFELIHGLRGSVCNYFNL